MSVDRVELELERRDTPKLPPPPRSAQNRSSFSRLAGDQDWPSAVTTSAEIRLSHRQPEAARQVADAAAERQAADAGGGDDAAGRRQAEGVRRVVEVAPAWRRPRRGRCALAGSTGTVRMPRQVDDDAVVAGAEARHAVAAAAHGQIEAVARARSSTAAIDVGDVRGADDDAPGAGRSSRCRPRGPRRTRRRRA